MSLTAYMWTLTSPSTLCTLLTIIPIAEVNVTETQFTFNIQQDNHLCPMYQVLP